MDERSANDGDVQKRSVSEGTSIDCAGRLVLIKSMTCRDCGEVHSRKFYSSPTCGFGLYVVGCSRTADG
jgi:hypothetical protein